MSQHGYQTEEHAYNFFHFSVYRMLSSLICYMSYYPEHIVDGIAANSTSSDSYCSGHYFFMVSSKIWRKNTCSVTNSPFLRVSTFAERNTYEYLWQPLSNHVKAAVI